MTGQEARDDEREARAIFEALADRLGEHPRARNHETADSGEYETFMHEVQVETLAEWLVPTVLDVLARKHSEPEMEYEVTYSSANASSVDGYALRRTSGVMTDLAKAREFAAVARNPLLRARTKGVPAGPWMPVGEGEQP
ncbi:hypothetical protein [Microbacterium sp. 77mftsu3.1]|uniref:hypothetical protein n=1 Tax=Microbacterium sp. 77mftsu3.1 TaxID=1761802 RepID=UPI000360E62E|nr:hypothetical protein [Microbacterium sp. 77mftsu3.1]SDG22443.1 hypothetical protein SAMN04488590_0238 [Microbacterium sp. 77mftsu3.1]